MLISNLKLDKDNNNVVTTPVSEYKPSPEEKAAIELLMRNWTIAEAVKNKPYREFNDMSLLQRQSLDQMRFNSYQEPESADPDEAWKSRAVRPITRNRAISIAAHLTAAVLHPMIHAQNDNDEEDRDAATVMRDLIEWAGDQSGYEENLVYAIIAALVNPAVVLHTEYAEVYRKIKEFSTEYKPGDKPSKWKVKEILDELYSGFKDSIVPLDELWLPDFYQRDIQKQPYIIRRRTITYDIAQFKYQDEPNFKYVKPGLQILFVDGEKVGQFYQVQDAELQGQLCEEVIYYDRGRDLQLSLLNGVLMCDADYPNPRQDKAYPFVMFGFEPIDEGKFAFYKSLVNKMGTDEDVIQTLYRMIIDGTYLQLMPPQAVFGEETVTASVMVPGVTTHFDNESTKMTMLNTGANLSAGLNVLQKVESSATESSIDPVMSGQQSGGSKQPQTAYEISRLEQNARVVLGLFGKMVGFAVKKFADLRISDVLQYMTIADVQELTSGGEMLKFRSFLVPNQGSDGRTVGHKVQFDMNMPDQMMMGDYKKMSFDLMNQEEHKHNGNVRILKVNPTLFRRRKFLTKVTADTVTPPSDAVKKALNLELFDRAIAQPNTNHDALTRDLLLGSYSKTASDPDKYMQQPQPAPMGLAGAIGAEPMGANMKQPGSMEGERAQRTNTLRQQNQADVLMAGR